MPFVHAYCDNMPAVDEYKLWCHIYGWNIGEAQAEDSVDSFFEYLDSIDLLGSISGCKVSTDQQPVMV